MNYPKILKIILKIKLILSFLFFFLKNERMNSLVSNEQEKINSFFIFKDLII